MSLPFHKHTRLPNPGIRKPFIGLRKKLISLFCVGALVLTSWGCSGAKTPPEENTFPAFLDEFFKVYAASDSLSLHYTVSHPEKLDLELPSVSLGQFSKDSLLASNDTAAYYLSRLQSFSKESLTPEQQFTYDLIEYALENSLLPEEAVLYDTPLGPTTGLQTQLPVLLAEYRFSSLKDVEEYFL